MVTRLCLSFFFSSRRRHTRSLRDWSSDVCSSDLGYTTAILVTHEHWRDVWTIPLAGLVAGIVGFVIGLPALRLSGLYLALATFGFAVALPSRSEERRVGKSVDLGGCRIVEHKRVC